MSYLAVKTDGDDWAVVAIPANPTQSSPASVMCRCQMYGTANAIAEALGGAGQ